MNATEELQAYVKKNKNNPNRSLPVKSGLVGVGESAKTMIPMVPQLIHEDARQWRLRVLEKTIADYEETFKAEIESGIKPSCIDRIYKWCTRNDLDPNWIELKDEALEALTNAIVRAVGEEVAAIPEVKAFLETVHEFHLDDEEDVDDF
jgi:hypothetical protein